MPYRRRSRRPVNRDKYSVEHAAMVTANTDNWTRYKETDSTVTTLNTVNAVVPASYEQGMRKVKHLTASFSSTSDQPVWYAIVYVPDGYGPLPIKIPKAGGTVSLYDSNQFVMASGVLDFSGGPLRVRSPLSRNLNSGDSIQLVLAVTDLNIVPTISAEITFAITLQ